MHVLAAAFFMGAAIGLAASPRASARKATFHLELERALGYGAPALELGFGFLQYFIHPNHRTVHDRIAETIIIRYWITSRPTAVFNWLAALKYDPTKLI